MRFASYQPTPADQLAGEMDMLAAAASLEESAIVSTWNVKVLDDFLRELQQGDDLLELEDFFSFNGQDLDA